MHKVTADSNIFISAFNWGGNPERLIDMARHGEIELAISEPIVNEIARILTDKLLDTRGRGGCPAAYQRVHEAGVTNRNARCREG